MLNKFSKLLLVSKQFKNKCFRSLSISSSLQKNKNVAIVSQHKREFIRKL